MGLIVDSKLETYYHLIYFASIFYITVHKTRVVVKSGGEGEEPLPITNSFIFICNRFILWVYWVMNFIMEFGNSCFSLDSSSYSCCYNFHFCSRSRSSSFILCCGTTFSKPNIILENFMFKPSSYCNIMNVASSFAFFIAEDA